MNFSIITSKIFILFILILNLNIFAQKKEFDIAGNWEMTDFWSNKSAAVFTKDGYISNTVNGEKLAGRILQSGADPMMAKKEK